MANTENLKSFQKGQSGNPAGRPTGSRNVSTVLTSMLAEIAPDVVVEASFVKDISKGLKRATIADAAAARIVYQGIVKGDSWALRELLDRTEGKAKQSIEISSEATIKDIVDSFRRSKELAESLNRDYGVPLPSEDEITEIVQQLAEVHGVDVQVLKDKVQDLKT